MDLSDEDSEEGVPLIRLSKEKRVEKMTSLGDIGRRSGTAASVRGDPQVFVGGFLATKRVLEPVVLLSTQGHSLPP